MAYGGGTRHYEQNPSYHEDVMKRHLFSIVNLAGHQCTEVLSYERGDAEDNFVTCENHSTYRIYVTPEGRVAVDKHSVE